MTVQAQNSTQYYSGPISVGTVLPIKDFTFIDNSHVSAKIRNDKTVWIYGVDYTVTGANTLDRNFTVLKEVSADKVLAIYLDVPITQGIAPEEGGNFPAATQEFVIDKLTYICQMLQERISRSLQISVDTQFNGTLPELIPNRTFKINEDGTGLVLSQFDPDQALAATEDFKNEAEAAAQAAKSSEIAAEASKQAAVQSAANATQAKNEANQIKIDIDKIKQDAQTIADKALQDIDTSKTNAISEVNSTKDSAIQAIKTEGNTQKAQLQPYVDKAKDWAIKMDGTVDGIDYSAKYYADEAKNYVGVGKRYPGEIVQINATASYIPENLLYTDGSTYTKGEFPDTYTDWLVGGKLETCTFEEFNQSVAQTGECWKWGLDTETETFRVPKINDIVVRGIADTVPAKGNGMTMGFTDGTKLGGLTGVGAAFAYDSMTTGVYGKPVGYTDYEATFNTRESRGLTLDPEKSGVVAVTENALVTQTIKHFVVVATGSINQSQMDWSAWASGQANKLNIDHSNDTKPYITETYVNGTSGYIVYSNGFCQQWGYLKAAASNTNNNVLTFLKEFANTDYNFHYQNNGSNGIAASIWVTQYQNKTTSSVEVWNSSSYQEGLDWYAFGYIN